MPDLDELFADVAQQLEEEGEEQQNPAPVRSTWSRTRKQASEATGDEQQHEAWDIREAPIQYAPRPNVRPSFDFRRRQIDAEQIQWESQEQASDGPATPRARTYARFSENIVIGPSPRLRLAASASPRAILRQFPAQKSGVLDSTSTSRMRGVTASPYVPANRSSRANRRISVPVQLIGNANAGTATTGPEQEERGPALRAANAADDLALHDEATSIAQSQDEGDSTSEDAADDDLMPDLAELRDDHQPLSDDVRTPEDDEDDLMPSTQDMRDPVSHQSPTGLDPPIDFENEQTFEAIENAEEHDGEIYDAVTPTSRKDLINTRHLDRQSAGFATPDPSEDVEDRQLIRTHSTPMPRHRTPRLSTHHASQVKQSPVVIHRDLLIPSGRTPQRPLEDDPFLLDSDGSPLDVDDTYVLPRKYVARRSELHGKLEGQQSGYSRISGTLRWGKPEELALYRTVQKVPISEEYPLRVVWFLHGEYGRLSTTLQQFNPQHMKDKMRTIVQTRVNNRRPVLGRARFWLPKGHTDKVALEAEMQEYRDAVKATPAPYDDLDELVSEVDIRSTPIPTRRSSSHGRRTSRSKQAILGTSSKRKSQGAAQAKNLEEFTTDFPEAVSEIQGIES